MSTVNVISPAAEGSTRETRLGKFLGNALTLGLVPVVLAGSLVAGGAVVLGGGQYIGALGNTSNGEYSLGHTPSPIQQLGAAHRKGIDDTIENISISVQSNLQSMIPSVSIEKLEPGMPSPASIDKLQVEIAHRKAMMEEAIQLLNKVDLELKTQENFPSKEQVSEIREAIGNFNGHITRDHQTAQDHPHLKPMSKYMGF